MKQTLILIITLALGIGSKDKRMEQKPLIWHEVDTTDYVNVDSSIRMKVYSHACIYDSCPHIIKDTVPKLPSKWTDVDWSKARVESKLVTPWTDASKADIGNNFTIKDSLGNIIEYTVKRLPAWKGLDGSSTPSGPIISPPYTVPGGPIILTKKDSLP